jgi:hypothetical protein
MTPPAPKPSRPASSPAKPTPASPAPSPSAERPGAAAPAASGELSPKEASNKRLADFAAKKAGVDPEPPPAPAAAAEAGNEAPAGEAAPAAPAAGAPAPAKPGRVNPWKLVDEHKAARASLEAEVTRLKAAIVPEADATKLTERATKAEQRAKELEDHIRFVDYQQSSEFKEKYQQPYEQAFARVVNELQDVPITDANGNVRAANANDFWAVLNAGNGVQARQIASDLFGPEFANDIMAYRREVKGLLDARQNALETERKNGADRIKQMTEQQQRQAGEISKFNETTWSQVEAALQKDAEISPFISLRKPAKEGDELTPEDKEWNDALTAGFKLIDENWPKNPNDPKLTPAERQDIIKKRVAIKYRAAAYSAVRKEVVSLRKQLAEVHKELAQYRETEPNAGGSQPGGGGTPATEQHGAAGTAARLRAFAERRAAGR